MCIIDNCSEGKIMQKLKETKEDWSKYICSIWCSISEGIMVYTFNVMLLVQIYGVHDVWHVRTGDTLDMHTRIRPTEDY